MGQHGPVTMTQSLHHCQSVMQRARNRDTVTTITMAMSTTAGRYCVRTKIRYTTLGGSHKNTTYSDIINMVNSQ